MPSPQFFSNLSIFIMLTIANNKHCWSANQVPSGWRSPTPAEISDDWRAKDRFKNVIAKGDFDGDGVPDEARILISEKRDQLGLFVFLGRAGSSAVARLLDHGMKASDINSMGIRRVAPGVYATACGKAYFDCPATEPPRIALTLDAIEYFKIESASSYFYWDASTRTFKKIWISD